ncbi:Superfamily II DNA or RNA helicase, SNF2 family [Amycolatopsis xylanica]|uniref:Superfamily II DNA or RNA helicase, SNF2 family n=1 Tax=Amycolatopsis xylanica TaxID=589385 RepID=A0A1H3INV7_9PSEU|nr:DEAD/DEAH box helicase [Amycolatopsis xylanica]SDY28504.1 Superfamily II DNA or RNA helicase, SNF2 family [Amycolatopsis xylanica]
MEITEHTQATYVPSEPPRDGVLALWGDAHGDTPIELLVTAGRAPVRTKVEARVVSMASAIPRLLTADPRASPTVAAWSAAVTAGVDLVSRGRLIPARPPDGDGWRAGPLDADDEARLRELAAALPPEAHALALSGLKRPRLHSPEALVRALWDATADVLARGLSPDGIAGPPGGAELLLRVEPREAFDADGMPGFKVWAVPMLRSLADSSLVADAPEIRRMPDEVGRRFGGQVETQLLLGVRRGARVWPPLGRVQDEPDEFALTDDEVSHLLAYGGRALDEIGITVLWPEALFTRMKAKAGVESPRPDSAATFTLKDLLEFKWQVSLGDEVLTEDEVSMLAEAKRPIVRLRGKWIKADGALLAKLRRPKRALTGSEALGAALTGKLELEGEEIAFAPSPVLTGLAERITSTMDDPVEPSPRLLATLRPYQRAGLTWLAKMTELGLGACLADDMGLGKTVQLIALHLHREALAAGPTLVVCPTSLLGNWEREIARFAPSVPVRRFHGGARNLDDLSPGEIVLATYGVARRDKALAALKWGLVAADEAQHVKNPKSATAKALRRIESDARVALTGTPMENRLAELWSILDWTTPGLLGTLDHFRRTVAKPIERNRDKAATERLATLVRPFLLRRKKTDPDIAPELPSKTETDTYVPLSAEQATLYEAVVRESMEAIQDMSGIERRGEVFKLLTALKQICNHPAQFLKEQGPVTGRSGKLAAFDELLDIILDEGESVLVFSQYVQLLHLLETRLADRGIPSAMLTGASSPAERDDMVRRFQAGEFPVFLLSLKAGGVGLNLTKATQVIHFDRWWNPAVEDQATDRAFRIGQDHPVLVHRLITEGTLEERIAEMVEAKRGLAESVVGSGETWISELSNDELADLVRLGSR